MHPDLFKIPLPQFLQSLFGSEYLMVHTYGFCIALGIIAAYSYTNYQAKKQFDVKPEIITNLLLFIIIAAIIGGKIFFYFENPKYYFSDPSRMLRSLSGGFVFYGSLLFAIPLMLWFFKKQKLPTLSMLDIIAVSATIVHAFGRVGCFNAGCCHGVPTDSFLGVVFDHPHCAADPKGVPLHPTQLYEVFMLLIIMSFLLIIKKRKQFEGQLFLIYLFLYAIGRSIIEIYRGDEERGYIIKNVLSHSQFISLFVLAAVLFFYFRLKKKAVQAQKKTK